MGKYQIEAEEEHLEIILQALDMYSRMGTGQLEVSVDEFLRTHFSDQWRRVEIGNGEDPWQVGPEVRRHVDAIKKLMFDHPPNGSWGIRNKLVPKRCRSAYDIIQVLRHCRAEAKLAKVADPEQRRWHKMRVDFDSYWATNPDLEPVTVKCVGEEG